MNTLPGLLVDDPLCHMPLKHFFPPLRSPFFRSLVDFITSGPVAAMVWKGKGVVAAARLMIGQTNPLTSAPGTIRGFFIVLFFFFPPSFMFLHLYLAF